MSAEPHAALVFAGTELAREVAGSAKQVYHSARWGSLVSAALCNPQLLHATGPMYLQNAPLLLDRAVFDLHQLLCGHIKHVCTF